VTEHLTVIHYQDCHNCERRSSSSSPVKSSPPFVFIGDDGINWDSHWDVEQRESNDFRDDPKEAFDYFLEFLPPNGGSVLEIGCGIGKWAPLWTSLGFRYTGLDASPSAIRLARERHPELDFRLGEAQRMEFLDEFDVVFSHTFLQHTTFSYKEEIFRRVYKSLKLGGLFVFQEKCDIETETTLTRKGWVSLAVKSGFEFLRSTPEGDPRNGFVVWKGTASLSQFSELKKDTPTVFLHHCEQ
jgi:SAM-dependent methyltransferase